jgi:hypothetical protein
MNYNLLLEYLSELQAKDWPVFRAALQAVADSEDDVYPPQTLRNLSALGHLEFTFDRGGMWTVCPSTLACLPRGQQISAVLCGARNHILLEALKDEADRFGGHVEVRPQSQGPDVIIVTVPSMNAVASLATELDLVFQPRAAETIAHCLPTLGSYVSLAREAWEPLGYKTENFDVNQLRWQEVLDSSEDGLYRYSYYNPEFRLRAHDKLLKVPYEIGVYALLSIKRKTVLAYDPQTQMLLVPVRAPLPVIFSRVATFCSGWLPEYQVIDGIPTRQYQRVPRNIADALMSQLGQHTEDNR